MRANDDEAVSLAGEVGPEVAGLVYRDVDRQLVEPRAQEVTRLRPLVGPGHAAGPVGAPGQVGELAEVGEDPVGVHPYDATAAGARSERGTKRPWPGWVTISPRS